MMKKLVCFLLTVLIVIGTAGTGFEGKGGAVAFGESEPADASALIRNADDKALMYTLEQNGRRYAGFMDWNSNTMLMTHRVFELPVSEMNNDERYPGWRNIAGFDECFAADRYLGGEHVPVDNERYFLNIGDDIWLNLDSQIIFFCVEDYGMDQTQWKQRYPDLVCQFVAPLLETKAVNVSLKDFGAGARAEVFSYKNERIIASDETVRMNEGTGRISGNPDFEKWGLDVLALEGDASGMSSDSAVSMAYSFRGLQGVCAAKWQGSSSLAYDKKNYTVQFDQAFEAAEGWGEQGTYCLKANYIDSSHARNIVAAKLWGQMAASRDRVPEKLIGLPNYGAIDGFPVIVTLNGEFHGLYTFNIPKDGWMLGMKDGEREAIVCADQWVDATGFKDAAAVDGTDFTLEYVSDENDAAWVAESLNRLIEACIHSDGTDLDTVLAQYIDWESAIDYYIFTVLFQGMDITRKNYLLSTYDGSKWFFTAYDMDSTMGLRWDGKAWESAESYPTFESYAWEHRLMQLIKDYKADELAERYWELRSTVLSEANVAAAFTNFAAQIPLHAYLMDYEKWPGIPGTAVNNVSQIRDHYRMRVMYVDEWIGDPILYLKGPSPVKWLKVVNCQSFVDLRIYPDTESQSLAQIPLGTAVRPTGYEENGLIEVIYNGIKGFITEDCLEEH